MEKMVRERVKMRRFRCCAACGLPSATHRSSTHFMPGVAFSPETDRAPDGTKDKGPETGPLSAQM